MGLNYNKTVAIECAIKLAQRATLAETILREALMEYNVNFEFQKPLYSDKFRYIADFFIIDQRLIVELDGSSHNGNKSQDTQRSADIINHYGYNVLRFKNKDVFKDVNNVIAEILNYTHKRKKSQFKQPKKSTSWKSNLQMPQKKKSIPLFHVLTKR